MGYGASLAFIAIGAVLAFAVKWDIPGIDLRMIGWILMGVGAVGFLLTAIYTRRARGRRAVEVVEPDMYVAEPGATPVDERAERPVEPHVHVRDGDTHTIPHVPGEDPYRRER